MASLWMIGGEGAHLGQSLWLREIHGKGDGAPPSVNLDAEKEAGELVREIIGRGLASAVHDISDGGLLVAAAEMALAASKGIQIVAQDFRDSATLAGQMFGEGQGRYLIAGHDHEDMTIAQLARDAGIPCSRIGLTGGDYMPEILSVSWNDEERYKTPICEIPLADLRAAHEGFFPALMQGEL